MVSTEKRGNCWSFGLRRASDAGRVASSWVLRAGSERVNSRAEGSILVLDPSCQAAQGHHLNSLLDLAAALAPRPLSVVVNAAMPCAEFGLNATITRSFRSTVYDEPGLGPRPNGRLARRLWKLQRALQTAIASADRAQTKISARLSDNAALFAQDWRWSRWRKKWPELQQVLSEVVNAPVAHIVVPSSDVELICGLAELRATNPFLNNATIHARLITLTPAMALLRNDGNASSAYAELVASRMEGVHLYVETPAMKNHLADTLGLASAVYPYLLSPPRFQHSPHTNGAMFGYFGGMRNEKGFSRLLPILRLVAERQLASDPAISFIIHGSDAQGEEAERLIAEFAKIARPQMDVAFIAGPLSARDYQKRFLQIDGALLPYTGARYAMSGSGIVCEALAMGKVILLSKGLSFGGQCDASHSIESAGDSEFASAILTVSRNLEHYRAAAAIRARRYQDEVRDCALLQRIGV